MTSTSTTPSADTGEIRRGLDLLHPGDDDVFEIRVLGIPGRGKPFTASGYFSDKDAATRAAAEYDARGPAGVYVTLSPVDPALLSRAPNRMIDYPAHTTTDNEIIRRRWVFVDIDAKRPSGIPATSDEMEAALLLAHDMEAQLRNHGFPETHQVNSGNGAYLLYPIDLPNDQPTHDLLKRFLAGLATLAVSPDAEVDDAVHNAARIIRLPGTTNRKAFSTTDRPHRLATLLPAPEAAPWLVTAEQLEDVAKLAPQPKASQSSTHTGNGSHRTGRRIDVPRYLSDHSIEFTTKADGDATLYILAHCPFDANHGAHGESAVVQNASGMTAYKCWHKSCGDRRWADVVATLGRLEDHHFDPPRERRERYEYNGHDQGAGETDPGPRRKRETLKFAPIPIAELLHTEFDESFLVDNVLMPGESCIVAGPSKVLKTSVLADLAVAVATGGMFLNRFQAAEGKVIVMSGESGKRSLRNIFRRVANYYRLEWSTIGNLWVESKVPKFGDLEHIQATKAMLQEFTPQLLIVDPLYFCIDGDNQANLAAQGAQVSRISELCADHDTTLAVAHHTQKGTARKYEPLDLVDVTGAGLGEWCRQWMMLSRREPYVSGSGFHKLHLVVGGSFGHGGTYGLDVDEGVFDGPGSRYWDVTVLNPDEIRQTDHDAKQADRDRKEQERINNHKAKVCQVLAKFPDGQTPKKISEWVGMSTTKLAPILAALLDDGDIEPCDIYRSCRKAPYDGYKLVTQ
jgi:hypothetical protein